MTHPTFTLLSGISVLDPHSPSSSHTHILLSSLSANILATFPSLPSDTDLSAAIVRELPSSQNIDTVFIQTHTFPSNCYVTPISIHIPTLLLPKSISFKSVNHTSIQPTYPANLVVFSLPSSPDSQLNSNSHSIAALLSRGQVQSVYEHGKIVFSQPGHLESLKSSERNVDLSGSEKSHAGVNGKTNTIQFDSIEEALAEFAKGNFVVVVDDEDRENEGDLIIAAEKMTPEKMAFMVRYTSGVICAPLLPSRCQQLNLPLMVPPNEHTEAHKTKYTISVDYRYETTTGISASDRSLTVKKLADSSIENPHDFVRPGHMFPLVYTPGGVLKRQGHTEAAVDLCLLSSLTPVGVISEITLDNGQMARRDDLVTFCKKFGLLLITIKDLKSYIESKVQKEGKEWRYS